MMIFKVLINSITSTIGRFIAYILIALFITLLIGGCEVNAATLDMEPWAVQLCNNTTCTSWNEDYTLSLAQSKGIKFYSVNLGTNYTYNLIKYAYLKDDLIDESTYDISFNIHLVNAMSQFIIPVTVNSVLCEGTINGPFTDVNSFSAALLTYTCKNVPVDNSKYAFELHAPISYASSPQGNMYLWISKLEYNYSQGSIIGDKIDTQIEQDKTQHEEAQETRKGILQTIIDLPKTLIDLFVDMLTFLFIPTEEDLTDILNSAGDLAVNFGFVGQSLDFVINLFTTLTSTVQSTGCITMPGLTLEFSKIGLGMDDWTMWDENVVCLSDNLILGNDYYITIIRTTLTACIVILFVNFAIRESDFILSKERRKVERNDNNKSS